jgi:hypothetical protein
MQDENAQMFVSVNPDAYIAACRGQSVFPEMKFISHFGRRHLL